MNTETLKSEDFDGARKSKISDIVKGFKDFTGEEALKREKIKEILVKTFKNYGFEPAETPVIEYEGFVKGDNQNDEAISDIFKLKDKGERALALRYELTFQLKRIALNKKLPYKRYQIGEVFRDEPTSSNRFRQFTQCDIDIIGSTLRDDAEILKLTSDILKQLKIPAEIFVNNRKLLNEILEKEKINDNKTRELIIKEIDKLDKLPEKEIKENLKKFRAEKVLDIFKKPESFFKKYDSYKEIEELRKFCNYFGVDFKFKPSLARGLSYYNGSVFEVKTKSGEMKESILGGGAYFINGTQSTGISFGLERISQLAKIENANIKLVVISINQDKDSIKILQELRKENISCLMIDKISKALEYANSKAIPYVLFVGEDEIKKKKFKLRDMKTGKEEFLAIKELVKQII